jgi:hypothetical protein
VTTYLKVRWHHNESYDPIVLYHEIEEDGREVRRIELFEDGRLLRSDRIQPEATTSVSLGRLPPIEEIRGDPQFFTSEIEQNEFEEIWDRAREVA